MYSIPHIFESPLTLIAAIPLALAIVSGAFFPTTVVKLPLRWLKAIVPVFLWLQLGVVAWVTFPVLIGSQQLMRFSPDFAITRLSSFFMLLSTAVAASCLSHAAHYFQADTHELDDNHVRVFYAAANLFLLSMTAVFVCDNLGALWIAVEATTLTSAPLVYFDRTKNAIEAAWKYLIICSVGIAFALLGTILIFASSQQGPLAAGTLQISGLIANAAQLNYELASLGAIFCLLGYGTKAGIFPLHNWLPDAHSEAPAPASAMLSGALLNCALYAIWCVSQILVVSQQQHKGTISEITIVMGAVTAVAASLMLIRQHSFKRMWAYSSIENVGIMLVTIGMGSGMLFFLQALNHSIAKVALFLVTGNIVQASGTKRLNNLHGVIASAPVWAVILTLGAFAITGAPPFGMFVSELAIFASAANATYWLVAVALLVAVSISFVAISSHVGRVICGAAKPGFVATNQITSSLMPGLLMVTSVLLFLLVRPQYWNYLR